MDTKGSISNWKINLPEAFGLAITAVAITLYVNTTFQSKIDASDVKIQFETRVTKVESELSSLRNEIKDVAKDTQYIRGRLEPKTQ